MSSKLQLAKGQHVLLAFFLSGIYIGALDATGFWDSARFL
jgi:hypothetical protein